MRVIAGTARSLKLKTPDGIDTRPTTDRIKETLFNMLQRDLPGSVFVDLFSGSGGIGIEALSRGAKKAYFVENNKEAYACLMENVSFTGFKDQAIVHKQDVIIALQTIVEKEIDIIFMDPPYDLMYENKVLLLLKDKSYVTDNTQIIIEAALNTDFSFVTALGYSIIKEKNYKTNKHVFLHVAKSQEEVR